jgi:hypothetical protein
MCLNELVGLMNSIRAWEGFQSNQTLPAKTE